MSNLASAPIECDAVKEVDNPGVYFIFLREGWNLLERTRYFEFDPVPLMTMGQAPLCYVGSSANVRRRMRDHMRGDSRRSNLRITIASVFADELGLNGMCSGRGRLCHFGREGEDALTNWFRRNAILRFLETDDFKEVEGHFIRGLNPPLNITGRRTDEYARHLMSLRRRFGYSADLPQGSLRVRTYH